MKKVFFRVLLTFVFLVPVSCHMNTGGIHNNHNPDGDIDADMQDIEDAPDGGDADVIEVPDPIVVVLEHRRYPVPPAPPNPVTGEFSPDFTNFVHVVRYYAENPRHPTQAVVLAYPGAQLGAGSYAHLAKNLIVRSEGAIEVWAYERRTNTLEDRTGIQAVLESGDIRQAVDYYSGELEIGGKVFDGVIPGDVPSYMSEWGLVEEVQGLKMILDFIPKEKRRSNVVLMGFSLGSPLVGQFAAWDFDGQKASDDLAAVIMLDGGGLRNALTEQEYHETGCAGSLGLQIGLDTLRAYGPYMQEMGLDSGIWIALELAALYASGLFGDPDAEVSEPFMRDLVGIFLNKAGLRLTARAALGVLADDQFSPAVFMRAGLGMVAGGPVEEYESIQGETLLRPASTEVLYSWLDYNEVQPAEFSSIADTARLILEGPTGAMEWYSPVRLNLDVCACDDLNVSPSDDDYRWRMGMRVSRNAEMDAPVLFFFAEYGEIWDMSFIENYRLSLPPVGEGRPNAGAPRDPALPPHISGFSFVFAPRYHHMDAILAAGDAGADYLYEPLLDFILANTEGTVNAVLP